VSKKNLENYSSPFQNCSFSYFNGIESVSYLTLTLLRSIQSLFKSDQLILKVQRELSHVEKCWAWVNSRWDKGM